MVRLMALKQTKDPEVWMSLALQINLVVGHQSDCHTLSLDPVSMCTPTSYPGLLGAVRRTRGQRLSFNFMSSQLRRCSLPSMCSTMSSEHKSGLGVDGSRASPYSSI